MKGTENDPGTPPPDLSNEQIECLTRLGPDKAYEKFEGVTLPIGTVLYQPVSRSHVKTDLSDYWQYDYFAIFVGANPRNMLYRENGPKEHFVVEKCGEGSTDYDCIDPVVAFTDEDWETRLEWSLDPGEEDSWHQFKTTQTARDFVKVSSPQIPLLSTSKKSAEEFQ